MAKVTRYNCYAKFRFASFEDPFADAIRDLFYEAMEEAAKKFAKEQNLSSADIELRVTQQ